ncbi:dipeptidase PepV [Clostridium sp. MB40-C1]|uniref:dipeptidase PepV n=1 Tax=Clostridium sp. MB40-C1 TaxID=3070996 RepID=UPI0027E158D6|nr:dipeptidase PepV [Clostridium sp. MB40-C1]WMJ80300.1 dipeptidase PepV [Clostridium sp. MB40-C1]
MQLNEKIDSMKEELVKSTQEVVKIKSVEGEAKEGMPFGEGPCNALKYTLELSEKLGFKSVNLDNYIGYAEYGDGEEYVGVLGHLDVVPEGDGWIHPPYGAEIHDGKMFGRGTMDDKGPIIAALYGLKAIKDLNLNLSKKVRIIFGTNEESGCGEIEHYFKTEKAPVSGFTPDAEYPIINGEKGITIFDFVKDLKFKGCKNKIKYIKGGQKANMVPDYCEAAVITEDVEKVLLYARNFKELTNYDVTAETKDNMVIIKSVGASAHGSTPELGKNAIMQLFGFIEQLGFEDCDIINFIKFFNGTVGLDTDGEAFGIGLRDEVSGSLSFNIGTIDVNEEVARMTVNLRYPVTCTFEEMMKGINLTIKDSGIRVESMQHQKPLYFPEDHSTVKALAKVYEEQTGEKARLLSIGGGTYAKEMPNIVAFGPLFPGEPELIHQPNEYIELEDLIKNAKIYAHAIYELAK